MGGCRWVGAVDGRYCTQLEWEWQWWYWDGLGYGCTASSFIGEWNYTTQCTIIRIHTNTRWIVDYIIDIVLYYIWIILIVLVVYTPLLFSALLLLLLLFSSLPINTHNLTQHIKP